MSKKVTLEEFYQRLEDKDINWLSVVGDFDGLSKKTVVQCKQCGAIFGAYPQGILRGRTCKCLRDNVKRDNTKMTEEEFISKLQEQHKDVTLLEPFTGIRNRIKCKCNICGTVWNGLPFNMLYNTIHNCPHCANIAKSIKQLKTTELFIEELKSVNENIEVIGKYVGGHSNIRCKCLICGEEWDGQPANLLRDEGCPRCKRSHGEAKISRWLMNNNIDFEEQKKFDGLVGVKGRSLSYDFYIPSENTLIEYQGQYHDHTARNQLPEDYTIQVEHDKRKREFAENNSIKLIEVWYYDNVDTVLKENLA